MTEASSCKKSFFGNYLRYRFGELKGILFVSIVLNLVTLPFVGIIVFLTVNRLYKINVLHTGGALKADTVNYMAVCAILASVALVVVVMIAALLSYNFFSRKECVDTLGALALTYRQRFLGDFLSGLISSMGTFIPCAVIGIGFFAAAQNRLNQVLSADNEELINIMPMIWGLVITLFFTYLFTYLFTTLAASCCGSTASTLVFSVISMLVFPLVVISTVKFANLAAAGTDTEIVVKVAEFCQPGGLLFGDTFNAISALTKSAQKELFEYLSMMNFTLVSPVNVVIMLIIAAALFILSYRLGKSRNQERIGNMFVHTGYFYVVTIAAATGVFMFIAGLLRNEKGHDWMLPLGFIISFVVAVVFEIIRRPRLRELPKSALRWAATAVCCTGLVVLIDATGAFGAINLPTDAESVHVQYTYGNVYCDVEFTDPDEISRLIQNHNNTVNSYSKFLEVPDDYIVTRFSIFCTTKSGKIISRSYAENFYSYQYEHSLLPHLIANVTSLPSYPDKLSEPLTGKLESGAAVMQGIYSYVPIPYEILPQFAQVLREDIIANYSNDGKEIGNVTVMIANDANERTFSILEDYENTIRLIRTLNGDSEVDPNAEAMDISLDIYKEVNNSNYSSYYTCFYSLSLTIYQKDLDNEKVKELIGLMEVRDDSDSSGSDRLVSIYINSMDGVNYYVPDSNKQAAIKLIMEIAAESLADNSDEAVDDTDDETVDESSDELTDDTDNETNEESADESGDS